MTSRPEVAVNTKTSINYRDSFAQFLTQSERSAYTIKNYLCDLDGFAVWLKSKVNKEFTPTLITPTDLREYKHYLDEALQLKPQTINRKLSSLRSFLNWAGTEGYFPDNRLPHVPQPIKEQASAPKWLDRLSQHDLCRIVEKGRKTRDIAIVKLLLNTGLRVSELCALTWNDIKISPKKGRLSVNHGKGSKRRIIPLNKDARSVLVELGYHKKKGSDQRVFIGQRGAMTPRGIESTLRKYVSKTDLEEVSPHQLRHTFYTWTSDQFSQYGNKPTISTMRDSTYVLDEILDNETELPIMEHTTDTAGYTELVFAMFDLLGLQFSPRIKDLGSQRLYRADRDSEYQHIESLLSGTITNLIKGKDCTIYADFSFLHIKESSDSDSQRN